MPGTLIHLENIQSQYISTRQVDVWLPPAYHADSSLEFPVLYMHDGQNLFSPSLAYGGVDWGMDEAVDRVAGTGQSQAPIVVGIWNSSFRWQEYIPARPFESKQGRQVLSGLIDELGGEPKSDAYLHFLVEELKPIIDMNYRTLAACEATFIMGSSMGGLISLYAVCEYPQVFSGAGCLSTHWPVLDGLIKDYLQSALPEPGSHRFYFDYGTETLDAAYEPLQLQVDEVMRQCGYRQGIDWLTRKFVGAEHSERAWRERVDLPLAFLLGSLESSGKQHRDG